MKDFRFISLLIVISSLLVGCSQFAIEDQTAHKSLDSSKFADTGFATADHEFTYQKTSPNNNSGLSKAIFSLSAFESPIQELLFSLASQAGFELEILSGVDGLLTIDFKDKTLDFILQKIANQLNLIISIENGVLTVRRDEPYWQRYRVDYVSIKRSRKDSIVMNMAVGGAIDHQASSDSMGSRSLIEITAENDFWLNLTEILKGLQPDLVVEAPTSSNLFKVLVNSEAGLVMVYGDSKVQQEVADYLADLTEITKRQVMIEASVVEVSLSDSYQAGIDWSNSGFINLKNRNALLQSVEGATLPENIFTANLGANIGFDLSAGLKMLEEFGDVKVISSPKIMAINNQSALLKVVDNQVYFTVNVSRSSTTAGTDVTYSTSVHTVPVGFMMSVTPFVNDHKQVSLSIRPTISRIIGNVADPNPDLKAVGVESLVPVIQEREMETMLRLNNLETAVIGGLIEDRNESLENGIVGLNRIPLIGKKLFGSKNTRKVKTELVVFIRPVVVEQPSIFAGDLTAYRKYFYPEIEDKTL